MGLGLVAATVALGASVLSAAPASAAELKLTYPVSGTSIVAKTGGELKLGPGTLKSTVTPKPGGGDIVGDISLPPSQATFEVVGFIPAKATVTVLPTGPAVGEIKQGALTARSSFNLQLTDIWVGVIPMIGAKCTTAEPVVVDLKSTGSFTVFNGGNLEGVYTIPKFGGCPVLDAALSSMISGPDNKLTFTLGKPTTGTS
ncbi:hypothetical protein EWH70_07555 [Amycolatopsis suaedae]|uniref:Uncharacterized protein n=1 Tax=Amycolatopsis suaedae TaxID=2510978 RepID=A0A4V2EMF9_9PSEU|nr:hypothetical protein EWH70_07555 [Amycolatopsis suaedae]